MYAEVIPQIRTIPKIGVFDYAIPPAISMSVGDIVKINFRNSVINALVYKIKQDTPYKKNIKTILSRLNGDSLSQKQVDLITWLAKKYNISLCLAFKTIFPEVPKKTKDAIQAPLNSRTLVVKKNRIPAIKKAISQTTPNKETQLLHYNNEDEKNVYISGLLKKFHKVLIIEPEVFDVKNMAEFFNKHSPVIVTSQLNKNTLWKAWNDIKSPSTSLIIGTKRAIFMPVDHVDLIIIDNEEDKSHANFDQNPKYHVLDVAEQLGEKIILTSPSPLVSSCYKYKKINLLDKINKINIIDMNSEKDGGNYSYFSNRLVSDIASHKKALLIFNRKGEAKSLVCKNCQEIMPYAQSTACPACGSHQLKKISFGITKIKKDLEKIFPDKIIVEITKEQNSVPDNYDIVIGTEYALRTLNMAYVDYIGLISVDHQLAVPDYQSAERVWNLIIKVANYKKETILQTHAPNNFVLTSACDQDYESFFAKQIALRKQYSYPPFDKTTK
jgi:primosomal protein N' (replication factor Y)